MACKNMLIAITMTPFSAMLTVWDRKRPAHPLLSRFDADGLSSSDRTRAVLTKNSFSSSSLLLRDEVRATYFLISLALRKCTISYEGLQPEIKYRFSSQLYFLAPKLWALVLRDRERLLYINYTHGPKVCVTSRADMFTFVQSNVWKKEPSLCRRYDAKLMCAVWSNFYSFSTTRYLYMKAESVSKGLFGFWCLKHSGLCLLSEWYWPTRLNRALVARR